MGALRVVIVVGGHHIAMQIVAVVVVVMVYRETFRYRTTEGFDKGGIVGDIRRIPAAADVLVQADNLVGGGHDQMQIMGDHDHTAVQFVPQATDQLIERGLAIDVHALGRFVQNQ